MKARVITYLPLLILILGMLACGPVVHQSSQQAADPVSTVALLPLRTETDIARERLDYLRAALSRELRSSGYTVLDDNIVLATCSTQACPERGKLMGDYGVSRFLELEVKSIDRADVVAAQYTGVSGVLRLRDAQFKELLAVDHLESQRGGLLFNSGQILQGIISTVEDSSDGGFKKVADKFATTVVGKLPPPATQAMQRAEATEVAISKANTLALGDGRYQLCIDGTSGAQAALVVDRLKSPLREISHGKYCGNFLLAGLTNPDSHLSVELSSPFGNSAVQALEGGAYSVCDPKALLQHSNNELTVSCPQCPAQCSGAKFEVYQETAGVFSRLRSLRVNQSIQLAQPEKIAVMSISESGARSSAVLLE